MLFVTASLQVDPWGLETFCGCPVWLHWNVRCISRILASPLQGEPSSGLMQYGYPLPQAETGVMVSLYWSLLFFSLLLFSLHFLSPCLGTVPIVHLHPGSWWSWQRLILFVFFCVCLDSGQSNGVQFSHFIKRLAFEESLPQSITVELITASCQHNAFLDLVWAVRDGGTKSAS